MERKITIEENEVYHEDYQMRMLQRNHVEGLLDIRGRGADGKSYYDYDVSGKVSLRALYEKHMISGADIRKFLKGLLSVVEEARRHLLDIHHILLGPEYIYYENGEYFFCYYPPGRKNLWDEFHVLTEYFVKHADYKDQECVQMVFFLHKETMEENYSLEKVAGQCLKEAGDREGGKEFSRAMPENTLLENESRNGKDGYGSGYEYGYDKSEHDWITEQEMGSSIMKETENMWTPVKRFLTKHRKPKWGSWDGLYVEEEEL